MTKIGFNTGSKWLDRYFEAYYEVIECYFDNLSAPGIDYTSYYDDYILPAAKLAAESLKNAFDNPYYKELYKSYDQYFFNNTSWDQIWDGYGYAGCDVEGIIKKWGFSTSKKTNNSTNQSNNLFDLNFGGKFGKRHADKITNFNPSSDALTIDQSIFGFIETPSLKIAKNKKATKKLAKSQHDFILDQSKGMLYFNENGTDHGFGQGGLVAIIKGTQNLSSENVDFI